LQLLNPNIIIKRTGSVTEEEINNPCNIVYDIGEGRYDHHQQNSPIRCNEIPYAAFGLLWKDYGYLLTNGNFQAVRFMDKTFISYLDDNDNTGGHNSLSYAISAFNPNWDEDRSEDSVNTAFNNAVSLAKTILTKEIKNVNSRFKTEKVYKDIVSDSYKDYIVFDDDIISKYKPSSSNETNTFIPFPWYTEDERILNVKFVIYKTPRGDWGILSTNKKEITIPQDWYDHKPDGINFVHKGLFMATATTKNIAVDLIEKAIENEEVFV
jgi:uncharacterized UPF0160 family protein